MKKTSTTADLQDFMTTGTDVTTTVLDFGDAVIQSSVKDDLSILTISGVYSHRLAKEIEQSCLRWHGNLGIEFKDIKVNPKLQKKFDCSVVALLKSVRDRYCQRRRLFLLCSPPPELVDLLKLMGVYDGYQIVDKSSVFERAKGGSLPEAHKKCSARDLQAKLVQKRILNLNQSLKRTVLLEKGLDSAQKCVRGFLPQASPVADGYDFAFCYKSSEKVGGDFFDFIGLDDDVLGIVIGDVSGHGIDAAILMGISKKVISIFAREVGNGSPKEVLCRANADLACDFHKYAFVTSLYGILELSTGRFTFARAGHEMPIVFGPDPVQNMISTAGMPMGLHGGGRFGSTLEEKTIEIPRGGYLLLSTDGIAEYRNDRGVQYSRDRLLFTVSQIRRTASTHAILDYILQSVNDFGGQAPQEDDITSILVSRLK